MVTLHNDRFLQTADRIANGLCRDAFWDGERCSWLGWVDSYENNKIIPTYTAFKSDIYGGTSGVAMFLAFLYRFSRDRQHLRVVEGAVNQAISLDDKLVSQRRYGVYFGVSGVALSYLRIGQCLQREELIKRGIGLLKSISEMPDDAAMIDVIAGSAGLIPVMLSFARSYQCEQLIQIARRHGEYLLKQAIRDDKGVSWKTFVNANHENLTGYAHGVAGIISALLELYAETSDRRFLQTALDGLRYESYWYSERKKNWVDLRPLKNQDSLQNDSEFSCGMAWCHGAPGIGLSRLRSSVLLPDHEGIRADLEVALATTAASLSAPWKPGNGNYSLCHGAAGNAELMLMAGQQLGRPELTRIAEKVGEEGIEFYVKQGLPWPCGNGGAGETPNLMLGTAGIGYFYLRLYDPVAVPSVLLISPDQSVS